MEISELRRDQDARCPCVCVKKASAHSKYEAILRGNAMMMTGAALVLD